MTAEKHIASLPNPSNILETDKIFCCLLDGNVFYSYNKPNTLCTLDDLKLIFEHYDKLSVDGPLKLIAEMGLHSSMDKPSREFLQNHEVAAICEAAVIHNLAQRILINFYHSIKRHTNPSKVFKSFENAWKWTQSMPAHPNLV